ncbi:MAG: c-type cytochrome [Betaproteobacteria bacterium]|nr:c-type cytochrome [Betaproteobacteria bacterium]
MKRNLIAITLAAGVALPAGAQALDAKQANDIMTKGACIACHHPDKKLVGPAYKDIAKKYKADKNAAATLEKKVRTGGGGVWGPVPMPPNPKEKITDEDTKKLVAWILTL